MDDVQDAMRPSKTDRVVHIPITFSKRSEGAVSGKTLFWMILTATVLFIIGIIGLITSSSHWYIKFPLALLLIYAYTFFLRFVVFREGRLSDAYEQMINDDYRLTTNSFWGIYEVSKTPPYTVYYANGLKGIFVKFDKDVIVGKEDYMEYRHFEGISDMYNVAHTLKLNMINIDYMDSVGNDPRMDKIYATVSNTSNPEMKAILNSVYSNLEHEMALDYTSFDVYLFTTRDKEEDLWYNVRQVIEFGLKANYKSYSLINPEELRKMVEAMMNLEEFSLLKAQKEVINNTSNSRIKPIKLVKADGSEVVINKTRQEIEKDRIKLKEERLNKHSTSSKNKVSKSNKNQSDDLVDLFDATSALDNWGTDESPKTSDSKFDDSDIF